MEERINYLKTLNKVYFIPFLRSLKHFLRSLLFHKRFDKNSLLFLFRIHGINIYLCSYDKYFEKNRGRE
jgi:hypothetical protein